MSNEVINKVKSTNQKYLKKNLENIPVKVMSQLENMDWTYLDLINQEVKPRGTFSPIEAMELSEIEANKSSLKEKGLEAIKAGKVAAILLAGGQGTRLGFDKAKGMFNIGETKELYIFEQLINNMMDVTNDAGCFIPLYIMTSEKNDKDTREFFEEHNYFGYDKNFVKFI